MDLFGDKLVECQTHQVTPDPADCAKALDNIPYNPGFPMFGWPGYISIGPWTRVPVLRFYTDRECSYLWS